MVTCCTRKEITMTAKGKKTVEAEHTAAAECNEPL